MERDEEGEAEEDEEEPEVSARLHCDLVEEFEVQFPFRSFFFFEVEGI